MSFMKIELVQGDITKINVDAIVNAANSSLLGGGGVDGAIHRAGGPDILKECQAIREKQGGCAVGEAVITNAGKLNAKKVIHTVGPVWQGGSSDEATFLKNCYLNSMKLAEEFGMVTLAFPNISTGIFGYPKEQAAQIAVAAVKAFKPNILQKVVFVCFDSENHQLYQDILNT